FDLRQRERDPVHGLCQLLILGETHASPPLPVEPPRLHVTTSSNPSTCLAAYSISSRSYQSGRLTERWLFSSFKRTATATLSQRWAKYPRWRTTWRTATTSVPRSPRRRAAAPGRSSPPKSSMQLTSLFDIGRRERQDEREELAGRLGEGLQERV